MSKIIPLVYYQDWIEVVLLCRGCGDACIYTFPQTMPINMLECSECGKKRLTRKIPRSRQF